MIEEMKLETFANRALIFTLVTESRLFYKGLSFCHHDGAVMSKVFISYRRTTQWVTLKPSIINLSSISLKIGVMDVDTMSVAWTSYVSIN